MFTLNIDTAISGKIIELPISDISNWSEIELFFLLTGQVVILLLEYDEVIYTGSLSLNTAGTVVTVVFNSDVAFPGGICLQVDCGCVGCEESTPTVVAECHNTNISSVNNNTRISVVDSSGCPVGYITMSQIVDFITSLLDIPETLCDLFDGSIPHSSGVGASDRVLIVGDDDCTVSSVSMDDAINCD